MDELELLLTEILGCQRHQLYLDGELKFNSKQKEFFLDALKKRLNHEPLQYILGKTEFMGLEFKVNPDVFIPRPETELLVEYTLKLVDDVIKKRDGLRILDVGTGSGCIAISLASFLSGKNVVIDALDISEKALKVASFNAKLHKVKVNFLNSDLFGGLKYGLYEIIVSNPPYIASNELSKLSREISYEPNIALDGGKDGLKYLLRIIKEAPFYLKDSGYLVLEIGYGQLKHLKNIFKNIKDLRIIEVIKDYNNIERIMVIEKYG